MALEPARALKSWHKNNLFCCFFDLIRVHSGPFAVQICFPSTLSKSLTSRSVLSLSSPNNFVDPLLRTSFVDEPAICHPPVYLTHRHRLNRAMKQRDGCPLHSG